MQRTVATSSAESEYAAASDCCAEALWLRRLYAALFNKNHAQLPPTLIYVDNKAAERWCYNPQNHAKQKHIDIAYHFVREQVVEFKTISVVPIASADNIADIGTKPLPFPTFEKLIRIIMNLGDRSLRAPSRSTSTAPGESVQPASSSDEQAQLSASPILLPTPAPTPLPTQAPPSSLAHSQKLSQVGSSRTPTCVPTPTPTFARTPTPTPTWTIQKQKAKNSVESIRCSLRSSRSSGHFRASPYHCPFPADEREC